MSHLTRENLMRSFDRAEMDTPIPASCICGKPGGVAVASPGRTRWIVHCLHCKRVVTGDSRNAAVRLWNGAAQP